MGLRISLLKLDYQSSLNTTASRDERVNQLLTYLNDYITFELSCLYYLADKFFSIAEDENKIILLVILIAASQCAFGQQSKVAAPFSIMVFGDMPYFLPADFQRFENVISAINEENPVFSVHVGDIKSSRTNCAEDYYKRIFDYFGQFKKPLIYTPGDNEWTDCGKAEAGSYDPEERLMVIRKIFFSKNESFGMEKIQLLSEASIPRWRKFVEINRWEYNNIEFATIHLVGSNNNFLPTSKDWKC